ncbi:MAG TPA: tRNA preQ1(34) S-adenosylmethionine ribosyltransferase-isomerase QueA [Stellaceae bacterium]|jgi:S-adenosylmethionine:tRNA ribosyltransferase-isomerase|nr:tRNA preQ1(34) S-adenosylmethionine ribosyltransferase-isomerase QueA [Stellaceae bacterium]
MRVDEFDFTLPRELIAAHPIEPRDAARLLVVGNGLTDHRIADLPRLLHAGDVLVANDTRVIPAQLTGTRGAAMVDVTLHRDLGGGAWRVFARGARRLKPGDTLRFGEDFAADVIEKAAAGDIVLRFDCEGAALKAQLERFGRMPLPPYIHRTRDGEARDRHDYQTMFAAKDGAVAAPTAGLHFTPALLAALNNAGLSLETVTLHVGAGTFLPVKALDTADHLMHAEYGTISAETAARLNAARARGGRIVAIGTTSLRLLESAADAAGRIAPFAAETALFITPGYRFRAVDVLLTNFHLPRSTLFMLVAAFAGLERMKAAYAHAVAARYRFFSYGDACLLFPASPR